MKDKMMKGKMMVTIALCALAFGQSLLTSSATAQTPPSRGGEVWTQEEIDAAREAGVKVRKGESEAFYRAGEFQIDLFGSASVASLRSVDDLNDHEAGAGFGVNYFFTRNFGLGYEVRGQARTIKSDWLNEGGVSAFYRLPIGTIAPYGVAGVGYEILNLELRGNFYAGAGLEVRLSPRVGVFTEVRRVWEGPKKYDARAGLRFAW